MILQTALYLGLILATFGGLAWIGDKFGWNEQKSQQEPGSAQLEEAHRDNYTEFFTRVVKPMMAANAQSLALEHPQSLGQHMPGPGSKWVGTRQGRIGYAYVFRRRYSMMGGIKEPRKIYHPFPVADMRKELDSYVNNYAITGGSSPCQDILVRDIGEGKVEIVFIF